MPIGFLENVVYDTKAVFVYVPGVRQSGGLLMPSAPRRRIL